MAGKRTFIVTVALKGQPDSSVGGEIAVDPDDIYQAGIDAALRALARSSEYRAGLRSTDRLSVTS